MMEALENKECKATLDYLEPKGHLDQKETRYENIPFPASI